MPRANAREQLTRKAKAAIHTYSTIHGQKHGFIHALMVDAILRAERMKRTDLYAYLERRGYRWNKGWWYKR